MAEISENLKTDSMESNQVGRPTLYKEEYNIKAYKLCLLGSTDADLASFFEVSEDTIYEWKKVHNEFSEAVKRGKQIADADVAESFFKRAKGFEVVSEKIFQYGGEIVRADTKTYYPPDAGAALNWLKNRQPKKWRDKTEVEANGTYEIPKINIISLGSGEDPKKDFEKLNKEEKVLLLELNEKMKVSTVDNKI
jgi:hypothetical protein